MNVLALALVLLSAVFHATWNWLAKRTHGGATFVWLYDALALLIYALPTAYMILSQHLYITWTIVFFMLGSGILHLFYFVLLQRGYRTGDLSLVYPLARGLGPLLSTLLAIIIFGERPSALALVGVALIIIGVFVMTGGMRMLVGKHVRPAVLFGSLTGLLIAGYTLWDKQAVSSYLISPVLLYYGATIARLALMTPYAWQHRSTIAREWHDYRLEALGVAILSPLAYFIVLSVLVFTPVSYVAPTREVSVLFGTIIGVRLLAEGDGKRRLIAACLIVLGIIALAL